MEISAAPPRSDLFVVGIGNPLREDDRVGIYLAERLKGHFGARFHGMVVYEPDIALAETISSYATLLIVDALATESNVPFRLLPILPAATIFPSSGYSSHAFDWGMILAMARDLFGHTPEAFICGVRAHSFGISYELSPQCRADAEDAFVMLCDFITDVPEREGERRISQGRAGTNETRSPC